MFFFYDCFFYYFAIFTIPHALSGAISPIGAGRGGQGGVAPWIFTHDVAMLIVCTTSTRFSKNILTLDNHRSFLTAIVDV